MDTVSHVRRFFQFNPTLDTEECREVVLDVNRVLDILGAGPVGHRHQWRKFLHNQEGIEYFRYLYGKVGAMAAEQHIVDDCGSVHWAIDYYTGKLDENGVPS